MCLSKMCLFNSNLIKKQKHLIKKTTKQFATPLSQFI